MVVTPVVQQGKNLKYRATVTMVKGNGLANTATVKGDFATIPGTNATFWGERGDSAKDSNSVATITTTAQWASIQQMPAPVGFCVTMVTVTGGVFVPSINDCFPVAVLNKA